MMCHSISFNRERERERQIDRQTDRETERERERNMHKNKSDRKVCNRIEVSNAIITFVKSTFFYYFILSKLAFMDEIDLYLSVSQKLFQLEQHS